MEAILEKAKVLLVALILYCAGFLISPYGADAMVHPFKVFLIPDYFNFYLSLTTIEEVLSPLTYYQWQMALFAIPLLLLALVLLLKKENGENRLLYGLLVLFALFMFLRAIRAGLSLPW